MSVLDSPLHEEIFPNMQPKPFLMQLDSASSHPVTFYQREEPDPHLVAPSCQGVVEHNKVTPEPPFLPQPLLICPRKPNCHQIPEDEI